MRPRGSGRFCGTLQMTSEDMAHSFSTPHSSRECHAASTRGGHGGFCHVLQAPTNEGNRCVCGGGQMTPTVHFPAKDPIMLSNCLCCRHPCVLDSQGALCVTTECSAYCSCCGCHQEAFSGRSCWSWHRVIPAKWAPWLVRHRPLWALEAMVAQSSSKACRSTWDGDCLGQDGLTTTTEISNK